MEQIPLTPQEKRKNRTLRSRDLSIPNNEEKIKLQTIVKAATNFRSFISFIKEDYEWNWHHIYMCELIDEFLNTPGFDRLMIFAPPRHGKSEIISRQLPAFYLGRNPNNKVISASYSADLASANNRDVQRIIDSKPYISVFPHAYLANSTVKVLPKNSQTAKKRDNTTFDLIEGNGGYRCAGAEGAITGFGANLILIDDVIKNKTEALSPTYRERLWKWYTSTLYTRQEKDAKILITLTRWHDDDLPGRILKEAENNEFADKWRVVTLPAIADTDLMCEGDTRAPGEALWANKYDERKLNAFRATIGEDDFLSLYQQTPTKSKGSEWQIGWFKFWEKHTIPSRFDSMFQSWDLTFKDQEKNDFVVGQVWGKKGANLYLLHQTRGRFDFMRTRDEFLAVCRLYPQASDKLIEDKANGPAIISSLKNIVPGIQEVEPKGSKIERARAASPYIRAGNIYLPKEAHWLNDFLLECERFPKAAHDDQIDAASQAILWVFDEDDIISLFEKAYKHVPDNY